MRSEPPLRIIWITPKYPLGAPDGARHATSVLVRNLTKLGVTVDLICLLPYGEQADLYRAESDLGVSSCACIMRSGSLLSPFPSPHIPLTFRTFSDPHVAACLHKELAALLKTRLGQQNTVLLFDGLHTFAPLSASYLKDLSAQTPLIYRAHNVEGVLWEQCAVKAETKPWIRWLYRHQAGLVRHFESSVARMVSCVASVSEEDAVRFRHVSPSVNASSVPIGMDFPVEGAVNLVTLGTSSLDVLFVGRLDWVPNKNGLQWFLEKVWPAAYKKRPSLRLKIAGVGDGRWLDAYKRLPGVTCLGKVQTLDPLYDACALTLAPLFQGSGTRVKILESARFARPVLSTALGAEGSGLAPNVAYFQAEAEADWIRTLATVTLEDCQSTGWRAFRDARSRFDGKAVAERFMETLKQLLPEPQGEQDSLCLR